MPNAAVAAGKTNFNFYKLNLRNTAAATLTQRKQIMQCESKNSPFHKAGFVKTERP